MEQIQFLRTNVAGRVPTAAQMKVGAIAMNLSDKSLYTKNDAGQVISIGGARDNLATSIPIGAITMWGTPAIPYGYLECNGQVVQKSAWPEFVELMTGNNTATSYTLPDMRDRFLKGVPAGRAAFSFESQAIQGHNHSASASSFDYGNKGSNTTGNHNHDTKIYRSGDGGGGWTGFAGSPSNSFAGWVNASQNTTGNHSHVTYIGAHSHTITIGTSGGAETRPNNIGVKYIIRVAATLGDDGIVTTSESLAKSTQAFDLASSFNTKITNLTNSYGYTEDGKIRKNVVSPKFDASQVSQEYILLTPSTASNATKKNATSISGRLKGARGSTGSGNALCDMEINVSNAYNSTIKSVVNYSAEDYKIYGIVTITYQGVPWVALKCATTGGAYANGLIFEGEIQYESTQIRDKMLTVVSTGTSNENYYSDVVAPNLSAAWHPVDVDPFGFDAPLDTQEGIKWKLVDMNTIVVTGIARKAAGLSGGNFSIFNKPTWVKHRMGGASFSPAIQSVLTTGVYTVTFADSDTFTVAGTTNGATWVMVNHTIPLIS